MSSITSKQFIWAALPLALALAGCGGGGGGSSSLPGPTPTPTPTPTPVPNAEQRIEPFDTSAAKSAAALQPTAARAQARADAVRTVALGPLPASQAKAVAEPKAGAPLQIGQARSVADTATPGALAALLQWQPTAQGTQVAALRFDAQGARGVRLGVLVQALPQGAVLRFYGAQGDAVQEMTAAELQAVAERNRQGGATPDEARTFWSADFGGPQTTLEVEIPQAASPAAVQLAVPSLSHFTLSPAEADGAFQHKVGESGTCNINATCRPEFNDQGRSVARMTFVEGGKGYLCTGTLMNDALSSGAPYFLSAHHCVSTQAVASTVNTFWFYRASACGSNAVNPDMRQLTKGVTLLTASQATDMSFMRLNEAPPAGVVYAGSYFGGAPSVNTANLLGVHHPSGDLQKVSVGTLQRYSNCNNATCSSSDLANGNFLTLNWQQGTTEGGSSGSAVFVGIGQKRYVTGQLSGGSASCSQPAGVDHYGRFDISYRTALKQWLNPTAP